MQDPERDEVIIDIDEDGIPDESEEQGATYAGLPLYEWGARPEQRDIFIHINYMESDNAGVIPRKEALDMVREVFEANGYAVHFDVGDLYHQAEGISLEDYDLDDQSHEVHYSEYVGFGDVAGKADLYDYKSTYLPKGRKEIFHYLLMAYAHNVFGCSGLAEFKGNDIIISLGQWGLTDSPDEMRLKLINYQAATIMHELGHNLGLRHGGFENRNYKPNYISIMNYQYQLKGIPTIGHEREGDRYYWDAAYIDYFTTMTKRDLHNGPYSEVFVIDYSDGSSASINENNTNEDAGLGRSTSNSVDFNGSNTIDYTEFPFDLNNDMSYSALKDYNDWANIKLFFYRGEPGAGGYDHPFDPIGNDEQDVSVEDNTYIDEDTLNI